MPWENKSVIDMKKEIMAALAQGQESVSSIALRYSISRKTLYKWKRRYEQEGDRGCTNGLGVRIRQIFSGTKR